MASTTALSSWKCFTHYTPADYARLKVPCASLAYIPMVELARRDDPPLLVGEMLQCAVGSFAGIAHKSWLRRETDYMVLTVTCNSHV